MYNNYIILGLKQQVQQKSTLVWTYQYWSKTPRLKQINKNTESLLEKRPSKNCWSSSIIAIDGKKKKTMYRSKLWIVNPRLKQTNKHTGTSATYFKKRPSKTLNMQTKLKQAGKQPEHVQHSFDGRAPAGKQCSIYIRAVRP